MSGRDWVRDTRPVSGPGNGPPAKWQAIVCMGNRGELRCGDVAQQRIFDGMAAQVRQDTKLSRGGSGRLVADGRSREKDLPGPKANPCGTVQTPARAGACPNRAMRAPEERLKAKDWSGRGAAFSDAQDLGPGPRSKRSVRLLPIAVVRRSARRPWDASRSSPIPARAGIAAWVRKAGRRPHANECARWLLTTPLRTMPLPHEICRAEARHRLAWFVKPPLALYRQAGDRPESNWSGHRHNGTPIWYGTAELAPASETSCPLARRPRCGRSPAGRPAHSRQANANARARCGATDRPPPRTQSVLKSGSTA